MARFQSTLGSSAIGMVVAQTALALFASPAIEARPLPKAELIADSSAGEAISGEHTWSPSSRMRPQIHASSRASAQANIERANAYSDLYRRVSDAAFLSPNWDNDGGHAPSARTIDAATKFLLGISSFARPPRPFVVGDGEIGFAWEKGDAYVQISFHHDGEVTAIGRSNDGNVLRSMLGSIGDWQLSPEFVTLLADI